MATIDELSDQFSTGTDGHDNAIDTSASTPCCANSAASVNAANVAAGFSRGALQALWQTGMQMCCRARPRSEILSLGELSGASPGNDLGTPGRGQAGCGVSGESHRCPGAIGGDLRDQPGAVTTAGGLLSRCHGTCDLPSARRVYRWCGGRHGGGQYDSGLSGWAISDTRESG